MIRHPGGRPIKSSKRDVLKGIRFTKTEYKTLEQKAAAAGVPVTAYIRQICLHGKVIQKMDEEERAFVRQLIGMANNLNQLTKKSAPGRINCRHVLIRKRKKYH